jgi:F0F1-type ATP synthase alpha subunit
VLDDVENSQIARFKKDWFIYFNSNLSELALRLNDGSALSEEDKKALSDALTSFKSTF